MRRVSIPSWLAALCLLRFGFPLYDLRGLVQTLAALRRSEYAWPSAAVERLTGCPPRPFAG